jgi:hypothetical protein
LKKNWKAKSIIGTYSSIYLLHLGLVIFIINFIWDFFISSQLELSQFKNSSVSIPITSFTNLICFKSLELFNVTHLLTSSSWGSFDMLKISSICVLMACVHTRDFSLSLESTHMHYPHCSLAPSPSDPYNCLK